MSRQTLSLAEAISDSIAASYVRSQCQLERFLLKRFDEDDRASLDLLLAQGTPKMEIYRILQRFGFYGASNSIYAHLSGTCCCTAARRGSEPM